MEESKNNTAATKSCDPKKKPNDEKNDTGEKGSPQDNVDEEEEKHIRPGRSPSHKKEDTPAEDTKDVAKPKEGSPSKKPCRKANQTANQHDDIGKGKEPERD